MTLRWLNADLRRIDRRLEMLYIASSLYLLGVIGPAFVLDMFLTFLPTLQQVAYDRDNEE